MEHWPLSPGDLLLIQVLPLFLCVLLGKLLNLSEPHILHL